MRIVALSVFYKNNLPTGFGFTFDLNPDELTRIWKAITTNAELMWRDEPAHNKLQLISLLTDQLEEIARRPKESRSFRDALLALMNVYLLEKLEIIHSDEYNGLVIAREIGRSRPQWDWVFTNGSRRLGQEHGLAASSLSSSKTPCNTRMEKSMSRMDRQS